MHILFCVEPKVLFEVEVACQVEVGILHCIVLFVKGSSRYYRMYT
jgi:hypothetical protein